MQTRLVRERLASRVTAAAVKVGVANLPISPQAAFVVGLFAATVLLGQVAAHLTLSIGVRRFVAAVTGKLRRFEAALIGEPAPVFGVTRRLLRSGAT
jgi:hypothetical protein